MLSAKEVLLMSVTGMAIVFAVLVLLMAIIKIMGLFDKKNKQPEAEEAAAPSAAVEVKEAPGSCGDVKLYDVPDKTAAMLMAITADKLGEPLNTLRFISIKEVKD